MLILLFKSARRLFFSNSTQVSITDIWKLRGIVNSLSHFIGASVQRKKSKFTFILY